MTVDREQTRRDAEEALAWLGTHQHDPTHDRRLASQGYRDALALLAELEQAERERDEADEYGGRMQEECGTLRAQLAKVPALVEALRAYHACAPAAAQSLNECGYALIYSEFHRANQAAEAALAAFEQEQKP